MSNHRFDGFSRECLDFYVELAQNNDKAWFEVHRPVFEEQVMAPARSFVKDMGQGLKELAPAIKAEPKVNRSLFRIHRDTRFSKDKSPYKTNLAVWFWEGAGPRMECSGFYLHLEPGQLLLGAGIYRFPRPHLQEFRASAIHPQHGPNLRTIVDEVRAKGYQIGHHHYKRLPKGVGPDHPNADLLLHNGLTAGLQISPPPPVIHSAGLIQYCLDRFRGMNPLHCWLVDLTARLEEAPPKPRGRMLR